MESNKNNKLNFEKRNLWAMLALMFITFGLYYGYWFYKTNLELKRYDEKAPGELGLMMGPLIILIILLIVSILISLLFPNLFDGYSSNKILFFMILGVVIIILFYFGFYYYRYLKSMKKVTKKIENLFFLFIFVLFFPIFGYIINKFSFLLSSNLSMDFLSYILSIIITSIPIIYLQSIYNKVSSQN